MRSSAAIFSKIFGWIISATTVITTDQTPLDQTRTTANFLLIVTNNDLTRGATNTPTATTATSTIVGTRETTTATTKVTATATTITSGYDTYPIITIIITNRE